MVPPPQHLPYSHWEVFLSAGTQGHHNAMSATRVDDVAVVWGVGTDTGRQDSVSAEQSLSAAVPNLF